MALVDERVYPLRDYVALTLKAMNDKASEEEDDIHTPSVASTPIERLLLDSEVDENEDEVPPPDSEPEREQTPLFLPWSDSDGGTPMPMPLFLPWSDTESERATPVPTPQPAIVLPEFQLESERATPVPPTKPAKKRRFLPLGWDSDDEEVPKKKKKTRTAVKKKAPRTRFTVKQFFDTEAAETEGDGSADEVESDDAGFIADDDDDDEPIHTFVPPGRPSHSFPDGDDEESAEDLEALAAEYEEEARRQRGQIRIREASELLTPEEKHNLPCPHPLAPSDSPPIFAIRVAPRRELSLLTFLAQDDVAEAARILSVFTWGVRSAIVCVEVSLFDEDDNRVLKPAAALIDCLSHWRHRSAGESILQPREVLHTEKFRLLCPPGDPLFLDPFSIGRRWVRITGQKLYQGDLAFVEDYSPKTSLDSDDYDCLHVVPRVAFEEEEGPTFHKHPPQRVLHDNDYDHLIEAEIRNQVVLWDGRIFDRNGNFEGLERLQVKQWRYQTPTYELNAIPTEEELDMFRQSDSRGLNVPFRGHACALLEGDRVVVAQDHPYWDAKSGVIIRLKTHQPKKEDPNDENEPQPKAIRIAVIVPAYDGTSRLHSSSPELADAWVVPVAGLRLHILAFQRHLRPQDRVRVVAGLYRNRYARIIGIESATVQLDLIPATAAPDASPPIELPLRLVAPAFRCGDVVRVIHGPYKGKLGFVVGIHIGGCITLYEAELGDGKLVLVSRARRQGEDRALLHAPDPMDPPNLKIDVMELDLADALAADRLVPLSDDDSNASPLVRIPSCFIVFERFDTSDVQLQSAVNDPWAELEVRRKKRRREMKDSERWLVGMRVQVVGKHPLKGFRAVVLGHHRPDYSQIELHINIDQRTTKDKVSFKSVVEINSRLPLNEAVILGDAQDLLTIRPRAATPRPPPSKPTTPEPPLHACYQVYGKPPQIEDINGKWLLEPAFVGKRIDVLVTDSEGFDFLCKRFTRLAERIRQPQRNMADQIGFLVPLTRPLQEVQIERDLIPVNFGNKRTVLPIAALAPCRTTPGGQSISAVAGRVIIIGPDVVGGVTRIGQYAEVIPGGTSWPDKVVVVRFGAERDRWGQTIRVTERYHLEALCRAQNVPVGDAKATNFDILAP
ncbi:hypothetical protein C8F01DRAFT_1369493 [Mycena amicta]|nr:hypothetical protein C8F01DRAFT_1369493 [Mycena amicta]